MPRFHIKFLLAVGVQCCCAAFATGALVVTDPGQGTFGIAGSGAAELSGLTFAGGSLYYAVSDNNTNLYPLTINLNTATGFISTASIGAPTAMSAGADPEGVAFDGSGNVFISSETGPAIRRHFVSTGVQNATVTVPSVYNAIRANLSLESLSRQSNGQSLWTGNEEALNGDGPISTGSQGTAVRLQKFNSSLAAVSQFAYITDPHQGIPISGTPRSGLSDLLVLPDGTVLALERAIGGFIPSFRSRIYEIDLTGATDVSSIDDLDTNLNNSITDEAWNSVSKTLLWSDTFGLTNNFEGITLGPILDNGDYSLLLVSDDGGGLNQDLLALSISGVIIPAAALVPEPSTGLLLTLGLLLRGRLRPRACQNRPLQAFRRKACR